MVTVCLKSWNWHTVPVIFHCLPLILSDNRRFLFSRHQLFFVIFVTLHCGFDLHTCKMSIFLCLLFRFYFLEKCIQVVGLFLSWAFYCWVLTSVYMFWRSFFSAILYFQVFSSSLLPSFLCSFLLLVNFQMAVETASAGLGAGNSVQFLCVGGGNPVTWIIGAAFWTDCWGSWSWELELGIEPRHSDAGHGLSWLG